MAKPVSGYSRYLAAEHQQDLKQANTVAILMAPRLGDTLLMMTLAHNLAINGRRVTIFGDYAHQMRDWFPALDIRPELPESQAAQALSEYDCVAQMHVRWPYALHDHVQRYFYYDAHVVVTGKGFVKLTQIRDYCRDRLGLANSDVRNGLVPLAGLRHRQYSRRVAVHPTSTNAQRCWAPSHFVELGLRLKRAGYDPVYILAWHEREQWQCLEQSGLAVFQPRSLSDVAKFIHECGWFIGNESGVGHLASNLGIPTLTVTGRPTRTRAWRPAWSPSRIVYPAYIPGGRWRDRLWRRWLRPTQVLTAFRRLMAQYERQASEQR